MALAWDREVSVHLMGQPTADMDSGWNVSICGLTLQEKLHGGDCIADYIYRRICFPFVLGDGIG